VVIVRAETERRLVLPHSLDERTVQGGLEGVFAQLDELLDDDGIPHRFCVSCTPVWFGCFVHLFPRAAAPPLFFDELEIDESTIEALPRLDRLRDVIPEARIFSSDFKCSARPSEIAGLIEALVSFATLDGVLIGMASDGEQWRVSVRDGRQRQRANIEDTKYVELRPVLPLLDAALARRKSPYRLHRFHGDGFDDGICLATPDEAEELGRLQYFVDPYGASLVRGMD
jgi:hypothetical protein